MADFYTNQKKHLTQIIKGILPKSSAVDILVGYFYFSGYKPLSEKLKNKKIRILVGLDVDVTISKSVREIENIKLTTKSHELIKNEFYNKFVKIFNDTDMLDSGEKLSQFEMFLTKIKDGTLEIRKTNDPCHAKMYVFTYSDKDNESGVLPGSVITGSSNLSYQGLEGRIEINARFNEKGVYDEAKQIFEDLWKTSIPLVDISNLDEWNNKVIAKIWYDKIYSPYLMYLRVLNEYFTIPTNENLLTPSDLTHGKYSNLRYQTDAVQMAINALEKHNGSIVADVVGLGKSIVAATVAKNLKLRSIIICPPHLVDQWKNYRFEFGFTAEVYSAGLIEKTVKYYEEKKRSDEQFLIIVDEAHRFRNEFTKDYADLHNLCSGNKVLLLTATPFNNAPEDIYSLLKLFQIPTYSTIKTVENLGITFSKLIDDYNKLRRAKRSGTKSDEEIKKKVEEISKVIRSIINPLVIRRSRLDLLAIPEYAKDLEEQNYEIIIPNDPIELTYNLSGMQDLYLRTLDKICSDDDHHDGQYRFKAARYSPSQYIREDLKKKLEEDLEKKTGVKLGLLLGRQANVAKFMRRLIVARFESSIAAFQKSLEYMIKSSINILEWIDKTNHIPIYKEGNLPSVDDYYEMSGIKSSDEDSTVDDLSEISDAFENYQKKGFFKISMEYINNSFIADVKKDLELLKDIRKEWFGDTKAITRDPKLEAFIKIIKKMLIKEPRRKLIVFSEYADTVNYLGEALFKEGLPVMKYTSADATKKNKRLITANFDASLEKDSQKDDFKLLVATDAISEGYNLHRAGAIFNYDIPYNPTRVIQRIGRINRINKRMFDELFIYNYFPTDIGESETHTKEISTLKMAMIHAIMGEDTKALTKDEEVTSYFKEQYDKAMKNSESESWDTKYRKFLNEIKATDADAFNKALEIPHRARTARKVEGKRAGILVFGKKGSDYVFRFMSNDETVVALSADDALSLFAAQKDEEPVKLSKEFDEHYQIIKKRLFAGDSSKKAPEKNKDAYAKVKLIEKGKLLNESYVHDLRLCIENDALPGYIIRLLNRLKNDEVADLPKTISANYLAHLINMQNKVEDSEEVLILTEEIQD